MSFLALIGIPTLLIALFQRWRMGHVRWADAMRWGMGLGFLFTGVDHFVHAVDRYVPMIPPPLDSHALQWVWATGLAEIMGAFGILIPLTAWKTLGLPNLRPAAGIGLALMLVCVVWANIHVAVQGQSVKGLDFGSMYYWIRPFFQPVFIAWALFASGAIGSSKAPSKGVHREIK